MPSACSQVRLSQILFRENQMDERLLTRLRELCAEPGPGDGVPRRRERSNARVVDRKVRQLCGAVSRAVGISLGESTDPLLHACWVESVEPFPDAGTLRVMVQTLDGVDVDALLRALRSATPWLRSEVAVAIQRRRTPRLILEWAGPLQH